MYSWDAPPRIYLHGMHWYSPYCVLYLKMKECSLLRVTTWVTRDRSVGVLFCISRAMFAISRSQWAVKVLSTCQHPTDGRRLTSHLRARRWCRIPIWVTQNIMKGKPLSNQIFSDPLEKVDRNPPLLICRASLRQPQAALRIARLMRIS